MNIPSEVKNILTKLQEAGFEAYAVGGCVRDLLLGRKPKDWDVATNALPEQIQQVFPESFYENKFGTVTVKVNPPTPLLKGGKILIDPPFAKGGAGGLKEKTSDVIEFVEVTTYRMDEKYTDKRHPDSVSFTPNLEEDLARRDFTINAMALGWDRDSQEKTGARPTPTISPSQGEGERKRGWDQDMPWPKNIHIMDPFNGQEDLKNGLIRAVGEPDKRFNEDALRLLRAIRFVVELSSTDSRAQRGVELSSVEQVSQSSVKQVSPAGVKSKKILPRLAFARAKRAHLPLQMEEKKTGFVIEEKTQEAIQKNASWLRVIAKERVRDEFVKIIMSERPDEGVLLLHDLGLLEFIIPELAKGFGVAQNKHHIYSIFEHGIFSLKFAAQKKYNFIVRLAALLHDVAKPQAKRGEGEEATFYNHDIMGARAAARMLERLRFDNDTIERVANLIRHHMFVYDVGAVTPAGVRRLLGRVGPENMDDLIALRVADRLGSGVPKAQPYRLRHFQYMVERVQNDPISVKMLKINGHDLMEILSVKPGPKIGAMLDVLLAEVIAEPAKNTKEKLAERVKQLNEVDLAVLRQMAKERIKEEKEEEDKVIKGRYWV
ncbi:HD domain-containing protein [Patescibacteria group bacterium]|nr:HD domain-containing protein [Patescibacteria group bacterium]